MKTRAALVAFVLVAVAAGPFAQQKPRFAGAWIIQAPNKAAGMEVEVKEDDKTVSYTAAGRTITYHLDGLEKRETMSMRGGDIVMLTTAKRDGATITASATTLYPNNIKTFEKIVWSIDAQGQLVIEVTLTADGKNEPPRITRAVHKRKA